VTLRFKVALEELAFDASRARALGDEWKHFHQALHGHHTVEDTAIFPDLRAQGGRIAEVVDRLAVDHRGIEPLLADGDRAFAELLRTASAASAVVGALRALLDEHLALEEAEIVPFLRGATAFPPPPTDADAAMYASGFAWSMHGVAAEVLTQVYVMLPEIVRNKLPAARAEYEARCVRAFGALRPGAATTPIPDIQLRG
jgi:hypothetical protein